MLDVLKKGKIRSIFQGHDTTPQSTVLWKEIQKYEKIIPTDDKDSVVKL